MLRSLTDVAMVQAADFGKLHDLPRGGARDRPDIGGVLVEREMRASPMIVRDVPDQDTPEVAFAQDQNVIQALAPDRADEPLREGVLPRALQRREDLLDPHAFQAVPKLLTVEPIRVAEEISRGGLVRKGTTIC